MASTRWRIRCLANTSNFSSGFEVGFAEIEMASSPAGTNLCTGGTASASTTKGGSNAPDRAFNGDLTNGSGEWLGLGVAGHWIEYEFATPVSVTEFRLAPCVANATATPRFMAFEYFDGDWIVAWYGFFDGWTAGALTTFSKPAALASARFWGLVSFAMPEGSLASVEIREFEMRVAPGGADQTGSGAAFATVSYDSAYLPANAFDDNDSTSWRPGGYLMTPLLGYDFGSAKSVIEIRLKGYAVTVGGEPNNVSLPGSFAMLKSANGRDFSVHSLHTMSNSDYGPAAAEAVIATVGDNERAAGDGAGIGDAATAYIIAVGAGMARIYADRVMETTTSTGTGDITVAGAVAGFRGFSGVVEVGDTFDYAIFSVDAFGRPNGAWETGRGTYTGTNTVERTVVHGSSNSDALVDLAAGPKQIILSHNAVSAALYRFGSFFGSEPTAGEVLMMHVATDEFFIPIDAAGSQFFVGTAPSATVELSLQVNEVEVGTVSVSTGGTATFDIAAAVEIEVGDLITLVAPGITSGIASCAFTFRGGLVG